jgi:aminotransferase
MTDITDLLDRLGFDDDTALARYMVEEVGVAAVPGSSFYPDPTREGRTELRFAFCKRMETLRRAALLLTALER